VALYPVVRYRLLRILAVAYPVMTALVVVATGNHYFLDVAAGALLTGAAWVAVARIGGRAAGLEQLFGGRERPRVRPRGLCAVWRQSPDRGQPGLISADGFGG
jgi:membrane-associated phospholipid phosphatase